MEQKRVTLMLLQLQGILYLNINNRNGDHFVSGGGDKLVKLWGYDDGMCYYNGLGHSGSIVKVFIKYLDCN
jgi:hypothetical protein